MKDKNAPSVPHETEDKWYMRGIENYMAAKSNMSLGVEESKPVVNTRHIHSANAEVQHTHMAIEEYAHSHPNGENEHQHSDEPQIYQPYPLHKLEKKDDQVQQ